MRDWGRIGNWGDTGAELERDRGASKAELGQNCGRLGELGQNRGGTRAKIEWETIPGSHKMCENGGAEPRRPEADRPQRGRRVLSLHFCWRCARHRSGELCGSKWLAFWQ